MAKNVLAICLMFLVASSVIYEVQGTFLLKMYLKRKFFPRRCIDFTPFACKGILRLMSTLQGGCPATREFKEFFVKFKGYMDFISSVSASSKSVDTEITTKCDGLAKAMSLLSGSNSRASSDFKATMLSMGKVLIQQKRSGSMVISRTQRRELIVSMVRWTRMIAALVTAAAEKRGKSIDMSSLGLDVDVNSSVESGSESDGSTDSGSPSPNTETPSTGSASPQTETPSTGSPSPKTGTPSTGSPSTENENSSYGSATSSRSGSSSQKGSTGSTYKDTTGGTSGSSSGSPTGSPSGSVPSGSGETSVKGTASGSGDTSSKTNKQSATESSKTSSTNTGSANSYSDATGATKGSPSGSPTGSPSGSVPSSPVSSDGGETSVKGTASGKGEASTKTKSQSTGTTSVKQVENETSKEVMSFISDLEKKYAGKAELKIFFDKLKTSMSVTSKLSSTDSKDFVSGVKSAAGKLSEAMAFVRSKFGKTTEVKTSMETYQEQLMKTLKELQDINAQIVSQSQGKTVTTTQQTELKQTITKWEQVTTQFVETAASSSSYQSQQGSSMTSS